MRPQPGGGATPITPKKGRSGRSSPQDSRATLRSRSSGMVVMRALGNSSGSVPESGRIRFQPQSVVRRTSSIATSSTWPGRAPRTATGPVRIWPGSWRGQVAWMARNSGGTRKPAPSGGRCSGLPDTVETVTRSPLSISSAGGWAASNQPQATVSGLASRRWIMAGSVLAVTAPYMRRGPALPSARAGGRALFPPHRRA